MDKYEDMKYLFILLQGDVVDNSSENDIYVRVTEIILRMIRDIEGKLQTLQECIEQWQLLGGQLTCVKQLLSFLCDTEQVISGAMVVHCKGN